MAHARCRAASATWFIRCLNAKGIPILPHQVREQWRLCGALALVVPGTLALAAVTLPQVRRQGYQGRAPRTAPV